MNFLEEIIEDPFKLWGSVIVVLGLLFYIFGGDNDKGVTGDPFADSPSFVSQEQLDAADEEYIEDDTEDNFVSEEDMQDNDSFEDPAFDSQQFQEPKFTYKKAVINPNTGLIQEKEFDMQGHEIKEADTTQDKDKRIEKLEKKVQELEQKVEKDPFSSNFGG